MLEQAQTLALQGAGQGESRSTSWIIFLLKRNCELACRRRSASPQRVSRSASATPAAAASCASSFPVCASTDFWHKGVYRVERSTPTLLYRTYPI